MKGTKRDNYNYKHVNSTTQQQQKQPLYFHRAFSLSLGGNKCHDFANMCHEFKSLLIEHRTKIIAIKSPSLKRFDLQASVNL